MQPAAFVAVVAAMASTAMAAPEKRSYDNGWCTLNIQQETRANNDDSITTTIYDNSKNVVGSHEGGLSSASPQSVASQLPHLLDISQPASSHDIGLKYDGYSFGTSNGCTVGDWDDGNEGTRSMDCGFAC